LFEQEETEVTERRQFSVFSVSSCSKSDIYGLVMTSVLHFRRVLSDLPVACELAGISVRNIRIPDDVAAWIALRDRSMAGQKPLVRSWKESDFTIEMSGKPWWSDDRTWLAVTGERGLTIGNVIGETSVVGAVTLALRDGAAGAVPVVHWLLVEPQQRRRGVGRLLMSHLERAAWDAGWREVQLETHADWREAVAFYQSMGYAPAREPSPR
jgi:GNAT superfamily N-acetyltransferase